MFHKKMFSACFFILLVVPCFTEVLYLKDGQVLKGNILSSDSEGFNIKTSFGSVFVNKSNVDRIDFSSGKSEVKKETFREEKRTYQKHSTSPVRVREENPFVKLEPMENLLTKQMFFQYDVVSDITALRTAVRNGDLGSTMLLGIMHFSGERVRQDYKKAFEYLTESSEVPLSMYYLGLCYEKGYGTEKNNEKALYWYRKNYDSGDFNAGYNYALLLAKTKNYPEALKVSERIMKGLYEAFSVRQPIPIEEIYLNKMKILQNKLKEVK